MVVDDNGLVTARGSIAKVKARETGKEVHSKNYHTGHVSLRQMLCKTDARGCGHLHDVSKSILWPKLVTNSNVLEEMSEYSSDSFIQPPGMFFM